jgi:hypothetical protein
MSCRSLGERRHAGSGHGRSTRRSDAGCARFNDGAVLLVSGAARFFDRVRCLAICHCGSTHGRRLILENGWIELKNRFHKNVKIYEWRTIIRR